MKESRQVLQGKCLTVRKKKTLIEIIRNYEKTNCGKNHVVKTNWAKILSVALVNIYNIFNFKVAIGRHLLHVLLTSILTVRCHSYRAYAQILMTSQSNICY